MLLLSHSAAQDICLAESEPCEHLDDLHNLLLIEHNAEGLLQDRLKERMHIDNFLFPVQSVDEIRYHAAAEGPGTIERHRRDQIDKAFWLEILDQIRHACRLHLKHGTRIAIAKHLCRLRILQRNLINIQLDSMGAADMVDRIGNDGQRAQPQEVHFEQAERLHIVFVELCDKRPLGDPYRHLICKRRFCDHDTGCVNGGITRQSLNLSRKIDDPARRLILLIALAKVRRFLKRSIQRYVKLCRDEFCDCRHLAERHLEYACDIANGAFCAHCAKGCNLRNMILTVTFLDIRNNPSAVDVVKINIDIRHRHALGVKKALKEECVLEGIDVRNAEQIGNDAACCRSAPRSDGHAVFPCVVDKIPNDEEVAGISHVVNDAKLIIKPLTDLIVCIRIAQGKTFLTERTQIGIIALIPFRHWIIRQLQFAKSEIHLTSFGNLHCVFKCSRIICKEFRHLLLRFQIVVGSRKAHAVRIVDCSPRLHTEQDIMELAVIRMNIVDIICCDKSDTMLLCQITKSMIHRFLFRESVILYFQEKIRMPEYVDIFANDLIRLFYIPAQNRLRNLSCNTGGKRDNSLMVAAQKFLINARFIIISLNICERYELNKVTIAELILGKKDQMIIALAIHLCAFLPHTRCEVDLASDNGMDPLCLCLFIESNHTVHDAVIGHSDRIHPEFFRAAHKLLDPTCAVQQTVFRVHMEMSKCHRFPPFRSVP